MKLKSMVLTTFVMTFCIAGNASWAADSCSWVTAAEFTAIVGGKMDGAPVGSGDTCTVSFDKYQRTAQVQRVDGFGLSSRYAGLVRFWQEENARKRKNGEAVEEKTIGDAFCSAAVPNFTSPTTECMQELPGKRVLYARVTAPKSGGKPPPMDTALKLLTTALPRVK